MATAISIFPKCNSVYISDPNGLQVMGQSPYGVHGIQNWQYPNAYQQKVCFSDTLSIQVHTQRTLSTPLTPWPELYLCDQYYFDNLTQTSHFHVVGAAAWDTTTGATHDLNVAPYLKGQQIISGNNYVNPFDNSITPLQSSMWAFSFTDLGISTAGTYYLMMENYTVSPSATKQLFSEPMQVATSHLNTMLFQSQFLANNSIKNIIVSGWHDDFPTDAVAYSPTFGLRCEGYILDLDPKAVNIGYLQQSYDQLQVMGQQKRMKTLKLGELSTGIPPYMLEMVTEQVLSDLWYINNYSYICFNPSSQSTLSDMWKSNRKDPWTLLYANTVMMERYAEQGAILSPYVEPYARIHDGVYDATYA